MKAEFRSSGVALPNRKFVESPAQPIPRSVTQAGSKNGGGGSARARAVVTGWQGVGGVARSEADLQDLQTDATGDTRDRPSWILEGCKGPQKVLISWDFIATPQRREAPRVSHCNTRSHRFLDVPARLKTENSKRIFLPARAEPVGVASCVRFGVGQLFVSFRAAFASRTYFQSHHGVITRVVFMYLETWTKKHRAEVSSSFGPWEDTGFQRLRGGGINEHSFNYQRLRFASQVFCSPEQEVIGRLWKTHM